MNNKIGIIALVLVAFIIITASIAIGYQDSLFPKQPTTSLIENAFVDVNGDGQIDLIVFGNVIMNKGDKNFIQQSKQPTQ